MKGSPPWAEEQGPLGPQRRNGAQEPGKDGHRKPQDRLVGTWPYWEVPKSWTTLGKEEDMRIGFQIPGSQLTTLVRGKEPVLQGLQPLGWHLLFAQSGPVRRKSKTSFDFMKHLERVITEIIQRAVDKGEHGSPAAAYAREVIRAVEAYYDRRRVLLFKGRSNV